MSVKVNNVRLIPNAHAGCLCCFDGKITWNGQTITTVNSIESVFIDKGSLTLLLTVKAAGFKLFQVEGSEGLEALQNWFLLQPQLKVEQNSSAYASFVNPSLRSVQEATLDVFDAFAQIPKRLSELFGQESRERRPRRQKRTLPTNPWINERPLHLTASQMTPGSSAEIDLTALDLQKCSLLVYNSGGSVLKETGWYWKRWSEAQQEETIETKTESVPDEVIERIEKDLPRLGTDDVVLTGKTRKLLLQAARCFPEVGYVQGMADLALPFARLIAEREEDSASTFLLFFNRFKDNFSSDSSSMNAQLEGLYANVQDLSPLLADWFGFNRDCRALLFAYRWLLVLLRREFKTAEADCIWSVMMAAEVVKKCSMQRYLLAFCTAMILSCKQELFDKCVRFEDVIKAPSLVRPQRQATMPKDQEEFGAFERHTKGIGMKLLLKMGYKPGSGLGKEEEGRAEPVQIKLRPRGVGIGFSDGEGEASGEQDEAEDRQFKERVKEKRARTEFGQPKRVKPEFVADDEFFKPASEPVQIIDMTTTTSHDTPLLQLKRNLLRAQQQLENKIALNERLAEEARRSLARTTQEISRLDEQATAIRSEMEKRRTLMATLNEFKTFRADSSLEAWQELLRKCQADSSLFCSLIVPNYRKLMVEDSENLLLPVSALCQATLPPQQSLQLFYHCWWPAHRAAFSGFNATDLPGWRACLTFLRSWKRVLPKESFQLPYLAAQILIPRLHSLLTASEGIVDVIGAFEVVSELQLYFTQYLGMSRDFYAQLIGGDVDRFMARMIRSLPLERCKEIPVSRALLLQRISHALSREFIVDPSDQDISVLNAIFSFDLPQSELVPLLITHVIPKLLAALRKWLRSPEADLEEVAQWYEAWKGVFEPIIAEDERFSNEFSQLLIEIDAFLNKE